MQPELGRWSSGNLALTRRDASGRTDRQRGVSEPSWLLGAIGELTCAPGGPSLLRQQTRGSETRIKQLRDGERGIDADLRAQPSING